MPWACHYVAYTSTDAAKDIGKPLWNSEDAMYGEPWARAEDFARLYNRNYIIGRMTKTIICTPITSLFENLVPFGVEHLEQSRPHEGQHALVRALRGAAVDLGHRSYHAVRTSRDGDTSTAAVGFWSRPEAMSRSEARTRAATTASSSRP